MMTIVASSSFTDDFYRNNKFSTKQPNTYYGSKTNSNGKQYSNNEYRKEYDYSNKNFNNRQFGNYKSNYNNYKSLDKYYNFKDKYNYAKKLSFGNDGKKYSNDYRYKNYDNNNYEYYSPEYKFNDYHDDGYYRRHDRQYDEYRPYGRYHNDDYKSNDNNYYDDYRTYDNNNNNNNYDDDYRSYNNHDNYYTDSEYGFNRNSPYYEEYRNEYDTEQKPIDDIEDETMNIYKTTKSPITVTPKSAMFHRITKPIIQEIHEILTPIRDQDEISLDDEIANISAGNNNGDNSGNNSNKPKNRSNGATRLFTSVKHQDKGNITPKPIETKQTNKLSDIGIQLSKENGYLLQIPNEIRTKSQGPNDGTEVSSIDHDPAAIVGDYMSNHTTIFSTIYTSLSTVTATPQPTQQPHNALMKGF